MAIGDKIILATQASVDNIVTTATGVILTFSAAAAPSGFLECDGSAISRTTYADLFAIIAETYGVGDGSTTFKIPDLRGEFIRGFDNGRGIDGSRAIGSTQSEDTKPHSHTTPEHDHTGNSNSAGSHTTNITVLTVAQNSTIGTSRLNTTIKKDGPDNDSGTPSVVQNVVLDPAGIHSHIITIDNSSADTTGNSGTTETRPRNIAMMFCIKT